MVKNTTYGRVVYPLVMLTGQNRRVHASGIPAFSSQPYPSSEIRPFRVKSPISSRTLQIGDCAHFVFRPIHGFRNRRPAAGVYFRPRLRRLRYSETPPRSSPLPRTDHTVPVRLRFACRSYRALGQLSCGPPLRALTRPSSCVSIFSFL